MLCRLATFYSRSRRGRWCKGETSGHFIKVAGIFPDCDRDSLIYLGDPVGPACHTVRLLWHNSQHMHARDMVVSVRCKKTDSHASCMKWHSQSSCVLCNTGGSNMLVL